MQYLRARYYDQNTGRFASVDPFEGRVEDTMSRHRYMYGNDNPVRYKDPSGMFASLNEIGQSFAIVSALSAVRIVGTWMLNVISNKLDSNIHWTGVYASASASLLFATEGVIALQAYFGGKISERMYAFVALGNLSLSLPISGSASTLDVFSPAILGTGAAVLSGSFSTASASFAPGYTPISSASAFAMGFGFGYSVGESIGFDIELNVGASGVAVPFFVRDEPANKPPIQPYFYK